MKHDSSFSRENVVHPCRPHAYPPKSKNTHRSCTFNEYSKLSSCFLRFLLASVSCLDSEQQNGWDEDFGQQWILFILTISAPEGVCWRPVHTNVTASILSLRTVPPCDRSASCRHSLMAECTVAPPGSCCTAEWEKNNMHSFEKLYHNWKWPWIDDGLTLLMLLGGGRLFGSLSVSTPSSQGNKSFHCFSLKRLSIGTTWPSVVKMYLLSDLWSGLSSSNSCNAREHFSLYVESGPEYCSDNVINIVKIFRRYPIVFLRDINNQFIN